MAHRKREKAAFISPNEAHLYWQSHVQADMIQRNRAKARNPPDGHSRASSVSPLGLCFANQSHSSYMSVSPEKQTPKNVNGYTKGQEFYMKKDNQPGHIPSPTIPKFDEEAFLNRFANRLATKPNSHLTRGVEEETDFIRTRPGWTNSVRQNALKRLIFDTGKHWTRQTLSKDL